MCDARCLEGLDGDNLCKLYDETIAALLDSQVPLQTKTYRRRQSNALFDDDCRIAKRSLGSLSDLSPPAVERWHTERRHYFKLLNEKRSAFWTGRIDAERSQPCRLRRSFDQLLGRGSAPEAEIDVLHRFFDDKVAAVRTATAGADAPQFTTAPVGCKLRLYTPVTAYDVIKMANSACPTRY